MKRIIIVLLLAQMLGACATIETYINKITKKPSLLIGYQTVELRDDIHPTVEIEFDTNKSNINDLNIQAIESQLREDSYYVVEGTAGGVSKNSQEIARKRVQAMIDVLESYGVRSSNIYVAQYSAIKKGRAGLLYIISY